MLSFQNCLAKSTEHSKLIKERIWFTEITRGCDMLSSTQEMQMVNT